MNIMKPIRSDPTEKLLAVLLVCFAVATLAVGYNYFRREKAEVEKSIRSQLGAIADLKAEQIARWRRERLNDADRVIKSGIIEAAVRELFAKPDDAYRQDLVRSWLYSWIATSDYRRMQLLDGRLKMRMTSPDEDGHVDPALMPAIADAIQTGAVQMADLHRDPVDHRIKMGLIVPLRFQAGNATSTKMGGGVVFEIDPEAFLFPHIQAWPTPSRTGETLLVRREGNDVVYLNNLRHRADTALKLRLPVVQPELPAALAVRGKEGIVEGTDYRGEPTLAAIRRISGSPWSVIAKQDASEIYAPLRQQEWLAGLLSVLLLAALLSALAFLWRNREVRFARIEIEDRKRAEEALGRQALELMEINEQLVRFNRATTGRELRMIELKREVNRLCDQLGQPKRYALAFDEPQPLVETATEDAAPIAKASRMGI